MTTAKRVFIVGSGAREHALAAAIADGGHEVVVAPGNAGTAVFARNVAVRVDDVPGLVDAVVAERADLVVVGPELPLTLGLVDALQARGVRAFGPTRAAAQLEGSKAFMKRFCKRHRIPTAPAANLRRASDQLLLEGGPPRVAPPRTGGDDVLRDPIGQAGGAQSAR